MDDILLNSYSRFIYNFIATTRKISLYPPTHPAIVSSINDIRVHLLEILKIKNEITMSISSDNKLIIENEPLGGKNLFIEEFITYFKKLNTENITFNSGLTEKELDVFLRLILLQSEQLKNSNDVKKILSDKGIQHIKVDQFSYIKIDKDSEPLVTQKAVSPLDTLKSVIRDLCSGKIENPDQLYSIEKQIFEVISAEFKEKKKLSTSSRNIFKKFLLYTKDKDNILLRLKNALSAAGFIVQDIDTLVSDIEKERGGKTENEKLKEENEELQLKLQRFQQELNEKSAILEEIEKQNKKISAEKQRIDNVIRNMTEGLIVIDPQGNIVMVNPTAEKILNITREDIGKPVKEAVKDEHLLTLVKKISGANEDAEEIELVNRDESTKKTLRTSSAVIEDHNGNTIGMVTTLNDITKQREIDNLKSGFLASVSHELRTPLVAIEKSLNLILSKTAGEISETQQQFLSIADRNLKRLTLLINDLLDLSKLEAGKMILRYEFASIAKIINESVETLKNWAKTKSITLRVTIPEALPEINVDSNRIIQVLNNLIGNAIKFTPENGTISVTAVFQKERNEIEVSVADTGIGIAQENLKRIFDKFYQVGEISPTDISGTGMGLAITKEIVELHGGRIMVESRKDKGANFIFTLPFYCSKDSITTNAGE